MTDEIKFELAEVIGINGTLQYIESNQTQTGNSDQLFSIQVQTVNRYTRKRDVRTARPANMNELQIPLIGEHVLIFRAYNQETTLTNTGIQWYYLKPYAIQSNINANLVPGISYRDDITEDDAESIKPGIDFKTTSISPIQPYEGDIIYQGRWGNTIRLGSTVKNVNSLVQPTWLGESDVDPIIIISNGQRNLPNKRFVVENIQEDPASLYLTSTQKISNFVLGSKNNKNSLECYTPGESQFANSQLIGVADRIILKAKTDVAIIDSERAIILNTTGDIKLGKDTASESMVHGDVLLKILQKILNQLNSPIQCGTMSGTFIDKSNIASAQRLFQNLLSSTYFIEKNTY